METTRKNIKSSLCNIKTQIGKTTKQISKLSYSPFSGNNHTIPEEQCKTITAWSGNIIEDGIGYSLMIEEEEFEKKEFEKEEKEEKGKESEKCKEEKEVGVENLESFVNTENMKIEKKEIVREEADLRVRVKDFKSDSPLYPLVFLKSNEDEYCQEVCGKLVPALMSTLQLM
jgi:hypothetical protein